jgi:hypothetical protein
MNLGGVSPIRHSSTTSEVADLRSDNVQAILGMFTSPEARILSVIFVLRHRRFCPSPHSDDDYEPNVRESYQPDSMLL